MSRRAVPRVSLVAVTAAALAAGAVAASPASAQGASGPGDRLTMIVPVSIGPGDPVSGARVQAIDPITKRAVSTMGVTNARGRTAVKLDIGAGDAFVIHATGGRWTGGRVSELMRRIRGVEVVRDGKPVPVNVLTTIQEAYIEAHPLKSIGWSTDRVSRYFGIPRGSDLGTVGSTSNAHFDGSDFAVIAGTSRGLRTEIRAIVKKIDRRFPVGGGVTPRPAVPVS